MTNNKKKLQSHQNDESVTVLRFYKIQIKYLIFYINDVCTGADLAMNSEQNKHHCSHKTQTYYLIIVTYFSKSNLDYLFMINIVYS